MQTQPNLLLILTDDQGYWAMGCAGNAELRTPNLDRLAATGLRFENFFCASPVCSPARASILTGRIPSQHGVQDFLRAGNSDLLGDGDRGIEYLAGQTAYTDLLARAGYRCGLSGKWHLGYAEKPQKSFAYWDVHATGSGPYYRAPMIRDGQLYRPDGYVTDLITDNALGFLNAHQATRTHEPFCLNVHYTAPHAPWGREHHPPALYDDYFNNCAFASVPDEPMHPRHLQKEGAAGSLGFTAEARRATLSGYFAAVTAMDQNVGRLLDWLEANNLREETLVIFTSDNGMNMGHHGIYGKGNGTFPPNMFDTSVKVPTMLSQPGSVAAGEVIRSLHSHYDLMPTLLDYVGVANPEAAALPGHSFAGILRGEAIDQAVAVVVYDEYGPTRMIRTPTWKYIHRYPYGPHELYDLTNDPDERQNLIDEAAHQTEHKRLLAELEAWFVRYVDPARDGTHEAVMGRGQVDVVGPAAQGKPRFGDDLHYAGEQ
ncbi:MAG: sulfatase-like hydrolase/transferase [Caldilineaceae bacterium]